MTLEVTARARHSLALAGVLMLTSTVGAELRPPAPPTRTGSPRALVDEYCVSCHNDRANTGGVSLQTLDFAKAGQHADLLERVLHKVRSGEMPPAGRPRPDPSATAAF